MIQFDSYFFLVSAMDRQGKSDFIQDGQEWKLFMVAHIQLGIDPDELVIAHGTSRFLPAQKYQDLVRKKRSGDLQRVATCQWTSDLDEVVLEVQENKCMVDTDKGTWNKLFKEFEEEGVSKWHVHSHDFERAEDQDDAPAWNIQPKATQTYYTWPSPTSP